MLAAHFWQATRRAHRDAGPAGALAAGGLSACDWPGNARELQNAVAGIAVYAPRRGLVRPGDVPATWGTTARPSAPLSLDAARRSFDAAFRRRRAGPVRAAAGRRPRASSA